MPTQHLFGLVARRTAARPAWPARQRAWPTSARRRPAAPNRAVLLFGVLIVGIALGRGAANGLAQLRGAFATTVKLERALGLPVVGAITENLTDSGKALRGQRQKKFFAATAGLAGLFVILLVAEYVQRGMLA
jgi:hypothetical protein